MVIRITSIVLSLAGLLALISGLVFWAGFAIHLISMHMLLGLVAVAALWVIAIAQAFARGGGWLIAGGSFLLGALTILVGLYQTSIMLGAHHWVIQVIHLLLGVSMIGLGHMAAARSKNQKNNRG